MPRAGAEIHVEIKEQLGLDKHKDVNQQQLDGSDGGSQQCPCPEQDDSSYDGCTIDQEENESRLHSFSAGDKPELEITSSEIQDEEVRSGQLQMPETKEAGGQELDGTPLLFTAESECVKSDQVACGTVGSGVAGDSSVSSRITADVSLKEDVAPHSSEEEFTELTCTVDIKEGCQEDVKEVLERTTESLDVAAGGSTKLCLVGDSGGADCHLQGSDGKTTSPLCSKVSKSSEGMPCADDSTIINRIWELCDLGKDAASRKSSSVETDPFLLCLRDTLTGTVSCEPLCSLSSSTRMTRSGSGGCLCGPSLLELIMNRPGGGLDLYSGSHELSKHSLSVSQPEVSTRSGTSETGSLQTSEDGTAVSTTLDERGRVVTEVSAHIHVEEQAVVNKSWVETQEQPVAQEVVRPARAGHLVSLDEYKRSVIDKKQGQLDVAGNAGTIHIRHQTRDSGYNYADIGHGAKLVASNKEAKGAGHILIADKDKYLRNPCSAEDKFVVVELSEETLVDSIVIANYEFHSSNVKELELLGSLDVCPTEDWMSLGKFEAENVRHAQRFMLAEPKWVRCLMLRLITHYGFEFYCTLSVLEVHGVDAIEHLLGDWVGEDGAGVIRASLSQNESGLLAVTDASESSLATQALPSASASSIDEISQSFPSSSLDTALVETSHPRHSVGGEHAIATDTGGVMARGREEDLKGGMEDAAQDGVSLHHTQGGRSSGDSVMKILMQKVKSLELNQSLFDGYLEDLNLKYKDMFNDLDQDLTSLASSLKEESAIRASLASSLHAMVAQPSLSLSFSVQKCGCSAMDAFVMMLLCSC